MAIGKFNSGGGYWIPPVGFVWLSTENVSPEIYFENTTWELISQNRVLMGAGDGHNGGDTVEAGLPNITGRFANPVFASLGEQAYPSGAFVYEENSSNVYKYDVASTTKNTVAFYASRSSSIYGNSTTVQPPAFYVYMWRRAS